MSKTARTQKLLEELKKDRTRERYPAYRGGTHTEWPDDICVLFEEVNGYINDAAMALIRIRNKSERADVQALVDSLLSGFEPLGEIVAEASPHCYYEWGV